MRSRLAIGFGLLLLLLVAVGAWNFQDRLVSVTYLALPTTSPAPTQTGSESSRADNFLNATLTPALVGFNQTLSPLQAACTSTLPPACYDAITTSHQKLRQVLLAIDHSDIPRCILSAMQKYHADLLDTDAALLLSLTGYQSQSHRTVANGLVTLATRISSLNSAAHSVSQSALTCAR